MTSSDPQRLLQPLAAVAIIVGIVIGAGIFKTPSMVAGVAVAALSGYASVKIMMRVLTSGSMRGFSIYLWVLGILILTDQFLTHYYF